MADLAWHCTENWATVLAQLPADFEAIARRHGQVNDQWANNKLKSASDLLRLVFLHVGANLPLRQTVSLVAAAGGPTLSSVRLHFRLRRIGPYLAELVARMCQSPTAAPERWCGYEMICVDATSMSGPGAEGTDARIHLALRLHDLAVVEAIATSGSGGETLRNFAWQSGQLIIADRGYSNAPGVAHALSQGADVLMRLNRGSLPLSDGKGKPVDVLAWCRTIKRGVTLERTVACFNGRQCIPGRLVAVRIPSDKLNEAHARVRKEYGSAATAEQLESAEYVVLFTTAPAERLDARTCIQAYRLRWQVELQFKRWKSLFDFGELPNHRTDTIVAWVTAKLLLGLVLERLTELPPAATEASKVPQRAMSRDPWKLTSITVALLISAIVPMPLSEFPARLPLACAELLRYATNTRPLQVTAFRAALSADQRGHAGPRRGMC